MAIGALTIIGVIVVVGGAYYAGNKITSEITINELYSTILPLAGVEDKEMAEMQTVMKQLDNNPEILQAKINWGRSAVAMLIVDNPNITKDLSADVLQKLQDEKNQYDVRQLEYKKLINEYKLKK